MYEDKTRGTHRIPSKKRLVNEDCFKYSDTMPYISHAKAFQRNFSCYKALFD